MFNKFKEQFSKPYLLEIEFLKNDISLLEEEVYSLNKQIVELNASIDSLKNLNSNLISLYDYEEYPSKTVTIFILSVFIVCCIIYLIAKCNQ